MRHFTISRSLLMLACGVAGLVTFEFAQGRDWPSWRGPNRDGISSEKGLLKEWPEEGPTLAWQSTGLGNAYSGVAVAGGKIYTMGQRRDTDLICLDGKNGKELWATKVGGGEPNCTPTVDGDLVYALGRDGDLLCARTKDGSEVWRTSFSKDFGGKMMSGWGYSESPLVDGDRLIVTPGAKDAMIVALDKKTGKVIWKSSVPDLGKKGGDGAAYSSIVISNAAGVKQYVQLTGRGVISVDAKDGSFLWSYNAIANGTANIPTPIVKGDYVFCSTGYNTGAALLEIVRKGSELVAEEIYFLQPKELQNHHGGMVLVGDYIYCGHAHNEGFPLCIEMKTGKTMWRPGRGPGSGSAAVIYADGELYFRYENGIMALIEATPDEYRLKGSFKLATVNGKSWPHPSIVDGQLYVRDGKDLLVYDIKAK